MDAKVLDGCDLATELVREVRADAAEDRFFTNRANMDMADRVISIVVTVLVAACVCARSRTCCLSNDRRLPKALHLEPPQGETTTRVPVPFVVVFVFERGAGR